MGLRVTGVNALQRKLENMKSRSNDKAREALKNGGRMIRDVAREMAPVDEQNLEKAIKSRVVPHSGLNNRNTVDVYVDEDMPGSHGKSVTVGDYALIMHEGRGSVWHELGKKSLEKDKSSMYRVGEKFLERAADEMESEVIRMIEAAYKREMKL